MLQNQGPVKKNNHVSPRCLLREWIVNENGRDGVHVYEIPKKKHSFSEATGQRAFSFAIQDYIYVPEINGARSNVLEDWFSGFEGQLASFIRKVKNGNEGDELISGKNLQDVLNQWNKLIHAIFSLLQRNRHDLKLITKFLDDNPHYAEAKHLNQGYRI